MRLVELHADGFGLRLHCIFDGPALGFGFFEGEGGHRGHLENRLELEIIRHRLQAGHLELNAAVTLPTAGLDRGRGCMLADIVLWASIRPIRRGLRPPLRLTHAGGAFSIGILP